MTEDHRTRFLRLALAAGALRFGEFTLKSGRRSPYFFNAGRFDSGAALAALAACYADAVDAAGLEFDLLFGPAYKGIPLATALACEYARRGRDLPLAFNRKEAKDHGEGGRLVGAPLDGRRVLLVDDVITAGTAALAPASRSSASASALRPASCRIRARLNRPDASSGGLACRRQIATACRCSCSARASSPRSQATIARLFCTRARSTWSAGRRARIQA